MSVLDDLRALLGPGGSLGPEDDVARYARDWTGDHLGVPALVVRPRSTEEVAAVMRRCGEAGIPVVPQGGHTGLVNAGTPGPEGREVVLSLERMNRVRAVDAENFSLIAEAGCILADVQRAALDADLFFPLALGAQGSCRLGGNVATNAGGLNVLRYGMTRDLVLGLEVVLPDGAVVADLRGLRKNNTGYDLKQLFIGSEGTLGVVTAVAVRLFPRPLRRETGIVALPSVEAVTAVFGRARRALGDTLSAYEIMTRASVAAALEEAGAPEPCEPAPAYALFDVATSADIDLRGTLEAFLAEEMEAGRVADGALAASEAQAAAFWRLREAVIEWQMRRGRHLRTDVALPISAIAPFLAAAEAEIAALDPPGLALTYGHVGDGNLHVNVVPPEGMAPEAVPAYLDAAEERIYALVDRHGGSISAEHGIGRKKLRAHAARVGAAEAGLARAIKAALDPKGILSPGRIFD